MAQLSWFEELTADQAAEVTGLLEAAKRTDGVAPVGEAVRLRMRPGATGSRHLLAHRNGELAGYAHVDMIGDSGGAPKIQYPTWTTRPMPIISSPISNQR